LEFGGFCLLGSSMMFRSGSGVRVRRNRKGGLSVLNIVAGDRFRSVGRGVGDAGEWFSGMSCDCKGG
jgi:hypothetical protein